MSRHVGHLDLLTYLSVQYLLAYITCSIATAFPRHAYYSTYLVLVLLTARVYHSVSMHPTSYWCIKSCVYTAAICRYSIPPMARTYDFSSPGTNNQPSSGNYLGTYLQGTRCLVYLQYGRLYDL